MGGTSRRLVAAALVTVFTALSCTAVVASDAEQCSSDADCAARGPDFAGTICGGDGVCTLPSAPAAECVKSSDCAAKGKGFLCSPQSQTCMAVENDQCKVVYGDPTADGALVFGLLSEVGMADSLYFRHSQHPRAAQLAFEEFFERSAVSLPGGRKAALVACSEHQPRSASAHLANLGALGVIGPAEEARQRPVVETLSLAGVPAFSPWMTGNPSAVLPASVGLAWITAFLRPEVMAPLNALIAEQETRLKAQLAVPHIRVAVVLNTPAGNGFTPYAEFADLMDQRLVFNGKSAIENGKDASCNNCYKRFATSQATPDVVAARAQAIADFDPDLIIPLTDIDWGAQLLPAIEKLYAAKPPAESRPTYVHPFLENEETGYRSLDFTAATVRQRVTGIRTVRDNGFELFQDKFKARFRPPSAPEKLGPDPSRGAAGAFETSLLLLLASYAAIIEHPNVTSRDIVAALPRVTDASSSTKVTLNDIAAGIQRLNAKEPIKYTGLLTSFDFDFATSATKPKWTSWCLSNAGQVVSARPYTGTGFGTPTPCP